MTFSRLMVRISSRVSFETLGRPGRHVAPYEIQVDGIAELWFKSQADFDAYSNSPATKRLRDDGATFIGREIDFITEEQVIIS